MVGMKLQQAGTRLWPRGQGRQQTSTDKTFPDMKVRHLFAYVQRVHLYLVRWP